MSTNKQNSNRKATVASAAVIAALLFGGGGLTLANWSDQGTSAEATITSGHLKLATTDAQWFDVSAPEGAKPDIKATPTEPAATKIASITDFRTVPGDTLVRSQTVTPSMLGENLKAKLTLADPSASGPLLADTKGVTVEYKLVKKDGTVLTGDPSGLNVTFVTDKYATDPAYKAAGVPTNAVVADGSQSVDVLTIVHFDVATDFDEAANANRMTDTYAKLAKSGLKLEQVRD